MTLTAGYDVGGAHLKVALINGSRVVEVRQIACPLWLGLDELGAALDETRSMTEGAKHHAVTMTGELTEIFPSRQAGVVSLVAFLAERLGPATRFFMGLKGFGDATAASANTDAVASANFLATARLVASKRKGALLIDMGSTTTDIILCDRPQGLSDAERLQTGELVYTGLTRTPVPSVTTRGVLAGQWQGLARDCFATMGDVRRVLGELPDDVDLHDTADGRGKSVGESLRRLARGFGRDGEERHLDVWRVAAAHIRDEQLRSIYDGAIQVLSRPGVDISGGVIAAGIGARDVEMIAQRLGLPCMTFGDLIGASGEVRLSATRYAPAVAVGMLA
jgi:(4-(4-[2-(gamma-L-glutamylamino)ethyl]phenoxymethyl)furan-2-yl)methanamine synthase